MIELPLGFSVQDDSPLEIGMLKDLKVLVKYIKITKNQSLPIYAKLDLNDNIKEVYPYFINNDIISSLKELGKETPYQNILLETNQPYLSYDLKNCPSEIYFPDINKNEVIKFDSENKNTKYYYYNLEDFKTSNYYPEFNFSKNFPTPDYVMIQIKENSKAYALGYLYTNKNYKKIKRKYFKKIFNNKKYDRFTI